MAYSRWSNSDWYTLWVADTGETRDEQVFEICEFEEQIRFTYRELKEDMESCLNIVRKKVNENNDMEELASYMKDFISDVEREYEK